MKPRRSITLLQAMDDPHLFKPWFRDPASWAAWRVWIAALFALPLAPEQLAIFTACTGRTEPPTQAAQESWLVCGRRSGKSFILALVAVFLACFRDHRPYLSPGERAAVLIIATDRKQARVILRYVRALLTKVPMLARMVEREWSDGFDLANSITIEVATASFRSVRGYTLAAVLLDEVAYFATDGAAEPDYEILAALRPGLATVPGALLLCASSPYARRGALWDAHRKHFGKVGDPVLVWQSDTRRMNPTVPQHVLDEAYERDPASAAAEFGAVFRSDIESFVSRDIVLACIAPGVHERPRVANVQYSAFVDPSGGSSDSMTLAVAHREGEGAILDAVRERRPPFSPEDVVNEFCTLLKSYGCTSVCGDRYAGEWPREQFRKHGIQYEPSPKPKSDLYRDLLPLLNSKRADVLDLDRLTNQLVGLERRVARGGRDSIDHAPGQHDDIANAVAGALVSLGDQYNGYIADMSWVGGPEDFNDDWHRMNLQRYVRSGGGFW